MLCLHESQLEEERVAWSVMQNEALDHSNALTVLWGEAVPSCNTQAHLGSAAVTRSLSLIWRL